MSKLTEEKRAIFTDAYRFYEEHSDDPDTVEAWQRKAKELGEICSRHGNDPLARHLMIGVYDALDEETKAIRRAIENA